MKKHSQMICPWCTGGITIYDLGVRVYDLGIRVWGLGCGFWGLGLGLRIKG